MSETKSFEQWCILEVMGHSKFAGLEQTIGGASFVRVDVPAVMDRQPLTKIFGAGSIYCITPVSEETARRVAATISNEPVSEWDAERMVRKMA